MTEKLAESIRTIRNPVPVVPRFPWPALCRSNALFAGLRVTAIDGAILDIPDSTSNAEEFGYSGREDTNRS